MTKKHGLFAYGKLLSQITFLKNARNYKKQNDINKQQTLSLINYSIIIFQKRNKKFSYISDFYTSDIGSE